MRVGRKQKEKYDWAIKYIKSEVKTGRNIGASLGSAGYTFLDDTDRLAEYARSIGDNKFAELITQ